MKPVIATLAWAAAFAALGALAMLAFGFLAFHHSHRAAPKLLELGAEFGVNIFAFAFFFARLPGARRKPGAAQPLGLIQGIWSMAGFGLMMVAGGALFTNILTLEDFACIARHLASRVNYNSHAFLLGTACSSELAAGIWVMWYFRRMGPVHLNDGTPAGLAWRPAPGMAYLAALSWAAAIIAAVLVLYHVIPPDTAKLQSLPMAQLFEGSTLSLLPLLFIVVILGPVLEELVFRGIAFAGLAARFGPVWSGLITTAIFMAAHAPEKIHYLPGFLDVGLLAGTSVLLRLKYRSIKPGILLHVAYNLGSMLAAAI